MRVKIEFHQDQRGAKEVVFEKALAAEPKGNFFHIVDVHEQHHWYASSSLFYVHVRED